MFPGKSSLTVLVVSLLTILYGVNIKPQKSLLAQPTIANSSSSFNTDQPTIKKIQFKGNTVFTNEELKSAVREYRDKSLSLDELIEIRNLITEYYQKQGYTVASVKLPPQNFTDGSVTLQVLEGSLSNIEVKGLSSLSKSFITQRLVDVGTPLNVEQLEQQLSALRDNDVIENIDADLQEVKPGQNLLTVTVEESNPLGSQFTLTNTFSPSVGSFGGNASFNYQLLGYGDILNLEYARTESDGLERFGTGYSIPINGNNTTLSLNYTTANSNVIEDPLTPLDIQADFQSYQLGVSQPISIGSNRTLDVGIGLENIQTENAVGLLEENNLNPFIEGLEGSESELTALRFFGEYSNQNQQSSLAFRTQMNLGLDVLDATVTEVGRDGLFWSWQGQGEYLRRLGDLLLVTNLELQLTPDQLLPVEQLGLGGRNQVRGYRQNLSIGDSGVIGSVGVEIPLFNSRNWNLRLVPFFDAGTIWNNDPEELQNDTLVSTGLGLRYSWEEIVSAQLDLGFPLIDADAPSDFDTDQEFSFLLQVSP